MIRSILRYISYILTAVVLGLFLLASFATEIPPTTLILPAFLGLAYPAVLLLMALCTLYWVLRWRWQMLALLAVVYALGWSSLSAYFPINRGATEEHLASLRPENGRRLKILSYNVCAFGFRGHSAAKPNPTLLYLKGCEADIICLQEANTSIVGLEQIQAYLGGKYRYIQSINSQESGSNLMLLSRFPIKRAERLPIHSYSNGAVAFVLDIDGVETPLVNLHFESFRLSKSIGREYMELVAKGDAWALEEALQTKFAPIFRQHDLQAKVVHEYLERSGRERAIVCGDFNDTPVSYALGKVGEGLQDCFGESGNGLGISFRSRIFRVRIDHILVGEAYRPLRTIVDRSARGSDHYPIYSHVLLHK